VLDWLQTLWDNVTSVSLPILALGLAFQAAQTCLVALAWRNILRAAYVKADVTYRETLAYYAGGNGLNAILPASAGTFAMLGLFRTSFAGATVPGLVGATVVQSAFFAVMSGLVYLWMFLSVAGSFDVHLEWLHEHWVTGVAIVVGGSLLVIIVVRRLWARFRATWEDAKEGGAIVADRRKFLVQVVGVEAASYVARMGVNATFMYAYDVPVSVQNVFLIVGAASISSTVAIAPGAVGAQTAMANVVLKGVAPAATINAYSIGQAVITTAWNVGFGLTLLTRQIGWTETRKLVRKRKKEDGDEDDETAALGAPVVGEVDAPPAP
jgi:uncharacterized membrane protein YbhN (UPF0104 family)